MTDILPDSPVAATPGGDPLPPVLRGWLHLVCVFLSLPAGAVVIAGAGSGRSRVAAAVYATGMTAMFGVSAAYHRRRWSPAGRRRMRRIDHGTIFLMIAGSYSPLCLVQGGAEGTALLVAAWAGAAVGLTLTAYGVAEKPVVGMCCYLGFAWVLAIAMPQLAGRLSDTEYRLLVAGGLLYTAGAIMFGTHRPNPFPRVFGYHEVWHVMVVAASVCHYGTIISVVRTAT